MYASIGLNELKPKHKPFRLENPNAISSEPFAAFAHIHICTLKRQTSLDIFLLHWNYYGYSPLTTSICLNSSPLGQNGRHFADESFRWVFMNEKFCILIRISLKVIPKGPIEDNPALAQIMAWRHTGDKPLSEPKLIQFIDACMRH